MLGQQANLPRKVKQRADTQGRLGCLSVRKSALIVAGGDRDPAQFATAPIVAEALVD